MSEDKNWNYITEDELIQPPTFKRTKHDGYLEESVDAFAKDIREKYAHLANEYNDIIYRLSLLTQEHEALQQQYDNTKAANENLVANRGDVPTAEELAEFEAAKERVAALEQENATLLEQVAEAKLELETVQVTAAPASAPADSRSLASRPSGPEDEYSYSIHPADDGLFIATVREFPELRFEGRNSEHALEGIINLVDDALMELEGRNEPYPPTADPTPPVTTTNAFSRLTDTKAEALLSAASDQAAQLVSRTEANMIEIEAAAQAEAEAIVKDARQEAETEKKRAAFYKEEANRICERMEVLYVSQLNELRSANDSIGYSPTLNEGDSILA